MISQLLVPALLLTPTVSLGGTALQAWGEEALAALDQRYVPRLLLVTSGHDAGGLPVFPAVDRQALLNLSYFDVVAADDAALTAKMNAKAVPATEVLDALEPTVRLLEPDLVLLQDNGHRRLLRVDRGHLVSIFDNAAPDVGPAEPAAILRFATQGLGYEGVVLAVRGTQILIASEAQRLAEHRQAVILENSADQPSSDGASATGAAIVEKVEADGRFAVFRTIFTKPNGAKSVRVGAKVVFQTN